MNFEGGLSQLVNLTDLGVNPTVRAKKGKHIWNIICHPSYYHLNSLSLRVFNIPQASILSFEVFYRTIWREFIWVLQLCTSSKPATKQEMPRVPREHNASTSRAKREQNVSKTRETCARNCTAPTPFSPSIMGWDGIIGGSYQTWINFPLSGTLLTVTLTSKVNKV